MLDQDQYLALMAKIVAEELPDEQVAFDLSSANVAAALYKNGSLDGARNSGDEFQFIEAATNILNFVTLMVGTFEVLRKLYKSFKKKPTQAELAVRWREELKSAGLTEAVADKIVSKFEGDIGALIPADTDAK